MSVAASRWAFKIQIEPTSKLVLLTLAYCHNQTTGQCNPRIEVLSRMTGYSRRTVQKSIAYMERTGILARQKRSKKFGRGQGSNQYVLSMGSTDFESAACDALKSDAKCREMRPISVVSCTPHKKGNTEGEKRDCSDVIDYSDVPEFPHHLEQQEERGQASKSAVGIAKKAGGPNQ